MRYPGDIPELERPRRWLAKLRLRHYVIGVLTALTADLLAFFLLGGGLLFRGGETQPPISIQVDMRDQIGFENDQPPKEPTEAPAESDEEEGLQRDEPEPVAIGFEEPEAGGASDETVTEPQDAEARQAHERGEAWEGAARDRVKVVVSPEPADGVERGRTSTVPRLEDGLAIEPIDPRWDLPPLEPEETQEPEEPQVETIEVTATSPRLIPPVRLWSPKPEIPLGFRSLLSGKQIRFWVLVTPEGRTFVEGVEAPDVPLWAVERSRAAVERTVWKPARDETGVDVDSIASVVIKFDW